ncbi:benzoate/H(+) symporter BenE family transporter [Ruegeria hyattellae]|uniref:benzoate/H(+) symporter BenE family transporter n=1 Tax=Ruegeria hyattellae TaxID=3233337 RepID=UPI00355AE7E4
MHPQLPNQRGARSLSRSWLRRKNGHSLWRQPVSTTSPSRILPHEPHMRHSAIPLQTVSTGLVVAVVGFFSSFPIVLQGLNGMGASKAEAASGLMAAAIAMGLAGVVLSLRTKIPVSVAWSTPGVALLAVSTVPAAGFAEAVGAFLFAGLLTTIAGFWRPLSRLIAAIPAPLAQAMLSAVLLSICLQPFSALGHAPWIALPVILTWFVAGQINRLIAVPCAVVVAALVVVFQPGFDFTLNGSSVIPTPVFAVPVFSIQSLIGIGLPLFIVTMATQNIPGLAIIRSFGYQPAPAPLISSVGGASLISAPFGAPATCLAAITAAMCANDDSHPDTGKRYLSAVFGGLFYCLFGLFAGIITAFAGLAPPLLLGTLAGVALLPVFSTSALAAFKDTSYRQAAAITFLVTASGVTIIGLSAAVWGLVLGGIVQWVNTRMARET